MRELPDPTEYHIPGLDDPRRLLRFFIGLAIGLVLSWLIVAGLIYTVELLLLVT